MKTTLLMYTGLVWHHIPLAFPQISTRLIHEALTFVTVSQKARGVAKASAVSLS